MRSVHVLKSHDFHRFRKRQLLRPECMAIAEVLREEWIAALYARMRHEARMFAYVDTGPRMGEPSEPFDGPDGKRYVFVPGEAP